MDGVFTPGLQLSGEFYSQVVLPILNRAFPGLAHSAARIDGGSEVLGLDDVLSRDHDWGPRLMLFLTGADHLQYAEPLRRALADQLPYEFQGFPTNFTEPDQGNGVQLLRPITQGPVNHRVSIHTLHSFFHDYLGFEIESPLEPADWLTFSEQRLLTLTKGPVFHDGVGLEAARARLAYYPRDVWLYLLAAVWTRLGQEEHLMGRAGMVGDEVGSALIAARLVRDMLHLGFLMEKTYAAYPKWLGSAFKQLACAQFLWPVFQAILRSETWQTRQGYLVQAYEYLAARQNALKLTGPLPEKVTSFYGRPFKVIAQNGFAQALLAEIHDPVVKRIALRPVIGNLDLFSDNVDLVSNPSWRSRLRRLFDEEPVQ